MTSSFFATICALFSKAEVLEYINKNHVNPVARSISKTDAIHMKEEADE